MGFAEELAKIQEKVHSQGESTKTEEATKNAFVMPFIKALGYDVFDPLEVVPEFTADVGTKKGEKVDYAIVDNGSVRMLFECKHSDNPLGSEHASQLFRYFTATSARIGILTNGKQYQFFTDLEKSNVMDSKPFLELDFNNIDETVIPEIQKLTREEFDLESILNAAEELKYVGQIKRLLVTQLHEPESDWVRFFTTRVYDGQFTHRVREQFTDLVLKATKQFITDQVNDRLKSALDSGENSSSHAHASDESDVQTDNSEENPQEDHEFEATFEELEGYRIVKAIVCSEVHSDRIAQRKSKSYFSVLLDDNNRKPVARLHFNGRHKHVGVFDSDKVETRLPVDSLEDIYRHADSLRKTMHNYD